MKNREVEYLIRKLALQNAIKYDGSARSRTVLSKLVMKRPDLKANLKEIIKQVNSIVREINQLTIHDQKKIVEETWPELLEEEKPERKERSLPPLPNVDKYPFIHVRFAPNPDGSLHLGGSRAAILCDEYAKKYHGRFTLRFDDTDPKTKSPIPEAYDWIREDLRWLNVEWHNEVYQSDRLEVYYTYVCDLIGMGAAYICTCQPKKFKEIIIAGRACPCRNLSSEEHQERWTHMLNGLFDEGDAVVRIKTNINHPNPAVRDWPALRIIDVDRFPHPRTGSKYRVWPLFAYCCGIDDHDLQISHILRGKEHLTNTTRQLFLYNYLGWKYPEAIHYGRFKMSETVLSKSKIRIGIEKGLYRGWDDPRLATLMSLRRRGFVPETVRLTIIEVGPRPVDITLSWDNINARNRKLIDPIANRYFFVPSPVKLIVNDVEKTFIVQQRLHPNDLNKGYRTLTIKPTNGRVEFLISKNDLNILKTGKIVRLMGLFNVEVEKVQGPVVAKFYSESYIEAQQLRIRLIHWIPNNTGISTSIVMPDASTVSGRAEDSCRSLKAGDFIQFERFGFVKIDRVVKNITAYYAHN